MQVPVNVPSLLADCTGGVRDVTVEATTLRGCLDALLAAHPLLRPHLFTQTGELRQHVNVFLNERNARWLDDWEVELRPGDTVTVIQAVSGG